MIASVNERISCGHSGSRIACASAIHLYTPLCPFTVNSIIWSARTHTTRNPPKISEVDQLFSNNAQIIWHIARKQPKLTVFFSTVDSWCTSAHCNVRAMSDTWNTIFSEYIRTGRRFLRFTLVILCTAVIW